jgi:flagellar L-ring protein precursor FlgH
MNHARLAALFALAIGAAGCGGVSHVGKYTPKTRDYPVPEARSQDSQAGAPGSLWRDGRASTLFTDARALRENDLLVVKIEEIADAKRSSDVDLLRQQDTAADVSGSHGGSPTIPATELKAKASTAFRGQGSTGRTERLIATVPAIVRKVLPNGNLFIEGHRVVLVNSEEQHFYVSGVVRPTDIDAENSVKSSMVADAEIEFTGRGVLSDNTRKGWVARFFGFLWPF